METVAGIIVYNPIIKEFLVLESKYGLDLPKGHIEEGETIREGAIRECFEETRLRPEIIPECHVAFEENNKRYFFFIGVVKTTNATISHEHERAFWVEATFAHRLPHPLSEALKAAAAILRVDPLLGPLLGSDPMSVN